MSVSVRLSQQHVSLAPGGSAEVTIAVANTSTIVEHYTVDAVRLPSGLSARADGVPVQLSVGEQAEVRLTLTAAVMPPPAAGATMVGVMVSSPHRREVRRVEELTVEVEPLPSFAAAVEPSSCGGRRRGEAEVVLRNPGNAPLEVDLSARDPQRKVKVALGASHVTIPPGGSARVTAMLSARPRPVGKQVRHQVAVTALPVAVPSRGAGPAAGYPVPAVPLQPWSGQVEFVQEPVLAAGLVRALGGVVGVVTMAGVLAVGAMMVRGAIKDSGKETPTSPAAVSSPSPSGGAASASGSPSAAGSPSASASPSSSPSASPTAGGGTASPTAPAPVTIDFTRPPQGAAAASQVIAANAYPGVVLAAPASADCAVTGSNLLWLDVAGLRFVAPGHADPADATRVVCQDGPLQLKPAAPAPALTVTLTGVAAPGSTPKALGYRLTFHDALGAAYSSDVALAPGASASRRLVDPSGKGLTDVTVAPLTGGSGTLVAVTALTVG